MEKSKIVGKEIFIENLVDEDPQLVRPLMEMGIVCSVASRSGELWRSKLRVKA